MEERGPGGKVEIERVGVTFRRTSMLKGSGESMVKVNRKKHDEMKQGRIHDCSCRGKLGRGSNDLGRGSNDSGRGNNIHEILISELFYLQTAQKREKSKV